MAVPPPAPSCLYRAWRRVSGCSTEEELIERLPETIANCGFGRVVVTALTENVGRAVSGWVGGDLEASARLLTVINTARINLAVLPMEAEMLRKLEPIVVGDLDRAEPVLTRVARTVDSHSYVAAPVVVEDRPMLMLHADDPERPEPMSIADADRLGLVAVLAGRSLERVVFQRRIATLRAEVRRANASVRVLLDDHLNAPLELAPALELSDALIGRSVASWFMAPSGGPIPTLTKREREVMDSVAAGLSNAQIAAALVISEQTVRSHLKRILRKLRASNRAEAVARWISVSSQSMPSGPSSAPARN